MIGKVKSLRGPAVGDKGCGESKYTSTLPLQTPQ